MGKRPAQGELISGSALHDLSLPDMPQGRLHHGAPVGVLDVGSNSVRLVIYEHLSRSLTPLFNEKISCQLGRGLNVSGELSQKGIKQCLVAVERFAVVAAMMHVGKLFILATAAARDAKNGSKFIGQLEKILERKVHVLTGEEEARFAGYGAHAGLHRFEGTVGDFGGGSLELARVKNGAARGGETYPLGAIALQDKSASDLRLAARLSKRGLKKSGILADPEAEAGGTFCAIGGTWRAIARLHQHRRKYPLLMVHEYQVNAKTMVRFCERILVRARKGEQISGMEILSKNRQDLLAYGAIVLRDTLVRGGYDKVIFSAFGVREGYLYDQLKSGVQARDPILVSCEELALLRARSPDHSRALVKWSGQALAALGQSETKGEARLREAACLLSDIGWRAHPDYRGWQAMNQVAHGSFVAIRHEGRAFLALTMAVRHGGLKKLQVKDALVELAGARLVARARLLGVCLRLAYLVSSYLPEILTQVSLEVEDGCLVLCLPENLKALGADKAERRLRNLANEAGIEQIKIC